MSKMFYKGRQDKREDYAGAGYQATRNAKPGSEESPIAVTVPSEERKLDVEVLLKEHSLFATIDVNDEVEEDISQLDVLLNKPVTVALEKTPKRNDPCSCNSGKKYKKCCGA